jgi:hypothetical protein
MNGLVSLLSMMRKDSIPATIQVITPVTAGVFAAPDEALRIRS